MSDVTVVGRSRAALRGKLGVATQPAAASPDARRALQFALAAIWLLDGVLQFQPFMYARAFAQMLGSAADGNPPVIARLMAPSAAAEGNLAR